MYIKVFHNIKNNKLILGRGGGGQDSKPKHSILFEILHLQNCDVKCQNFQGVITKKII